MEIKIRSLLDGLEDSSVPMEERDVVSAMRIKELTNMKLNLSDKKPGRSLKRRALTLALAAALVLALSVTAYAAWNVHAARQQALKEDLQIEEKHADSYLEYELPPEAGAGLVLLSAVNDGQEQRVYVNISPVTEEEAAGFPKDTCFSWHLEGTELGGFAAPQLPPELSLSGEDEIREAVMTYAYDEDSQTMTLQCLMDDERLQEELKAMVSEIAKLEIQMAVREEETRSFGPVSFAPTQEQRRVFDFGGAVWHDEETGKSVEIAGLELTPFSAVWKVRYEGAEDFHRPEADWEAYAPWSELEDRVCVESELIFSDGSSFSTGGAMTCPFEDGVVNLHCAWGAAIDIDDVQRIVLGDLVLWEAD